MIPVMAKNPLLYAVPAILLAGAAAFAADAPPDSADLQRQLLDAQDKLSTALRSYSLLQDQMSQLKTDSDKSAAVVDSMRSQLRQTQDEVAALASENAKLKGSLALSGASAPGGTASPTRPGPAARRAPDNLSPVPVPAGAVAKKAAPPAAGDAAEPRIHVVVEGDTLTRISKEYYGTANRYDEILAANRDVVRDENILVVGTKLKIP